MGQITNPAPPGITVLPTDRQSGPAAGAGASGNRSIFLGAGAGQNSTQSDLIVIGNAAGDAGMTAALSQGNVVLGSGSLSAYTGTTVSSNYGTSGVMAIGWNVAPLVVERFNAMTLIGAQVMANMPANQADIGGYVVIGSQAMQNQRITTGGFGASGSLVMIGNRAGRGTNITLAGGGCRFDETVVIGGEACANSGFDNASPGTTVRQSVVIGHQAGINLATSSAHSALGCVLIGSGVAPSLSQGTDNILIGRNITVPATTDNNILIGGGITGNFSGAVGGNIVIGTTAQIGAGIGARNIVIGNRAGVNIPAAGNDFLDISTDDGTTRRAALFCSMATGNMIVGNSTLAQRAIVITPNGATNILQIPNGTVSATLPVNSGYLYVSAGALRYRGPTTDTLVAPA